MVTRRRFVSAATALAASAAASSQASAAASRAAASRAAASRAAASGAAEGGAPAPRVAFQHGVASGDPLSDRVVLWTRLAGGGDRPVPVRWEIASDSDFRNIVNAGVVTALPSRDHTGR